MTEPRQFTRENIQEPIIFYPAAELMDFAGYPFYTKDKFYEEFIRFRDDVKELDEDIPDFVFNDTPPGVNNVEELIEWLDEGNILNVEEYMALMGAQYATREEMNQFSSETALRSQRDEPKALNIIETAAAENAAAAAVAEEEAMVAAGFFLIINTITNV